MTFYIMVLKRCCDTCVHIHQDYKCAPKYCDHFNRMYIPYPWCMCCAHHHRDGEIPLDRSIRIVGNVLYDLVEYDDHVDDDLPF